MVGASAAALTSKPSSSTVRPSAFSPSTRTMRTAVGAIDTPSTVSTSPPKLLAPWAGGVITGYRAGPRKGSPGVSSSGGGSDADRLPGICHYDTTDGRTRRLSVDRRIADAHQRPGAPWPQPPPPRPQPPPPWPQPGPGPWPQPGPPPRPQPPSPCPHGPRSGGGGA